MDIRKIAEEVFESGFKIKVLLTKFKSFATYTDDDYQKVLKMIVYDI